MELNEQVPQMPEVPPSMRDTEAARYYGIIMTVVSIFASCVLAYLDGMDLRGIIIMVIGITGAGGGTAIKTRSKVYSKVTYDRWMKAAERKGNSDGRAKYQGELEALEDMMGEEWEASMQDIAAAQTGYTGDNNWLDDEVFGGN